MVPKYSCHALRHFAITQWIVGGQYDLKHIQYLAGHSSLVLTLDRYGHFVPKKDAHKRARQHEALLAGEEVGGPYLNRPATAAGLIDAT
jgi:integrase